MNATSVPTLSCPELTPEQIAKASRHLMQTRDALLESAYRTEVGKLASDRRRVDRNGLWFLSPQKRVE